MPVSYGRCESYSGSVTAAKKCDSSERGVKGTRNVCKFREWCDGHERDLKGTNGQHSGQMTQNIQN